MYKTRVRCGVFVTQLQKHEVSFTQALLILEDCRYLTREIFQSHLAASGLDRTSTSLPIVLELGAATTAAAVGLPDWLIQLLGGWSSNAYQTNIRNPQTPILQVADIMARTPSPNPN